MFKIKKMKTNLTLLSILFIISGFNELASQVVITGKGESTVLFQNSSLGFDLKESELSFKTNNYTSSLFSQKGLILGGMLKAKNKSGTGDLLKSSEITPSSKIQGTIGGFWSNSKSAKNDLKEYNTEKLSNEYSKLEEDLDSIIKANIEIITKRPEWENYSEGEITKLNDIVENTLKVKLNRYNRLKKTYYQIKDNTKYPDTTRLIVTEIYNYLDSNKTIKRLNEIQAEIRKQNDDYYKELDPYFKITGYLQFGLNSEKFKLFNGWDTTNISKSFNDKEFRGGNINVGLNLRIKGRFLIGGRYSYVEGNNVHLLSKTKYKYSRLVSSNNISYNTSSEFSAYSGSYKRIYYNKYDFDFVTFIERDSITYLTDFYVRVNTTNNKEIIPNTTDLGISVSIFKKTGKFLGGLYVELPDLDQNIERMKEEPDYEDWYNRIQFGIYAKYSFSSLLQLN